MSVNVSVVVTLFTGRQSQGLPALVTLSPATVATRVVGHRRARGLAGGPCPWRVEPGPDAAASEVKPSALVTVTGPASDSRRLHTRDPPFLRRGGLEGGSGTEHAIIKSLFLELTRKPKRMK